MTNCEHPLKTRKKLGLVVVDRNRRTNELVWARFSQCLNCKEIFLEELE